VEGSSQASASMLVWLLLYILGELVIVKLIIINNNLGNYEIELRNKSKISGGGQISKVSQIGEIR
jgi:hypothetical protein